MSTNEQSCAQGRKTGLKEIAQKLKLTESRAHIFLCMGPECCSNETSEPLWKYLKARTKELGQRGVHISRTKVDCLRICRDGPIALVYPGGFWLNKVDEKLCDTILDLCEKDLNALEAHSFARNPLQSL